MNINLGYPCLNLTLSDKKIFTNRGMIKKTFIAKGNDYAADLALMNLTDLKRTLIWNAENSIHVYRMSSCLFPWMTEYEFEDLYNYDQILKTCQEIGEIASSTDQRLSFHPGHFDILATNDANKLKATILDLNRHAQIMDMMNLRADHHNAMNIHVGAAYCDKKSAIQRFCDNFHLLQDSAKKRLTVENDDKANMYSVSDLFVGAYEKINIPIVFDFHHHRMCSGNLSEKEALHLAATTWPSDIRQLTHYSSSKKLNEDSSVNQQAHADYVYEEINSHGLSFDIEIEAKAKELALIKYRKDF